MPLADGQVFRLTVAGEISGQVLNNVWFFKVAFASDPAITPAQLGEAWWNHVKVNYRGVACTVWTTAFTSILVEQVNVAAGAYGTFPIPLAEQAGTRVPAGAPGNELTPSFIAAGMRLNVSTKVTRPGQKRLWGLVEGDLFQTDLGTPARTAALLLGSQMDDNIILGAPAALTEVHMVIRKTAPDDVASVDQRVTGTSVSNRIRSQVSRRLAAY